MILHKTFGHLFVVTLMLVRLAYVTHEDICKCFKGDTLLAIQAPSGTQLEVPIPEIVSSVRYMLYLTVVSNNIKQSNSNMDGQTRLHDVFI